MFQRSISFRVKLDAPSNWTVSFTRDGDSIDISLIFGDGKPNQGVTVSLAEFRELTAALTADT
jgi:hypothetical protein